MCSSSLLQASEWLSTEVAVSHRLNESRLVADTIAFCDVWAYVPKHLYNPPINAELLGNADVIPGPNGSVQITFKLLSVDPANYDDAPSEGIRRLLQIVHGKEIRKGSQYDTSVIGESGFSP